MSVKEEILKAAIELFSKNSFEGVSIREIAAKADVHFASIRYHFGDKENLYAQCISMHGESRLISAQKYLKQEAKSPEDMRLRLAFAIEDVFRIHNENPYLTKLLLQEVESISERSDLVLKKTMVAMSEVFTNFFISCQKNKFIESNIEPQFLTQSLMGILHHFMRTELARERLMKQKKLNHTDSKDKLIENILHLFLRN